MTTKDRSSEILQGALDEAQKVIEEQQLVIERLTAGPWKHGCLLEKRSKSIIVGIPGDGALEFPVEGKMPAEWKVGGTVRLSPHGAIADVTEPFVSGPIAVVSKLYKPAANLQRVEVSVQHGGRHMAYAGQFLGQLEDGDEVSLDGTGTVIVARHPKLVDHIYAGHTGVSWDDIIGLDHAKVALRSALELPVHFPEVLKRYGRKRSKGMALDGPAGCGKTMLGKAAATAIQTLYGGKAAETGFIYVKGPEILNKWVGESEAKVRGLFASARKHQEKHGYPAVMFIDEADAILRKRGTGRSSDMESTIVPMFLACMDGLDESGAFVLLATNRIDTLDPAILREGRIDRKLAIGRPDLGTSAKMFAYYLQNKPLCGGGGVGELSGQAANLVFDKSKWPLGGDKHLHHEVSGAMIAGIVDRAVDYAIAREIDAETTKDQGMVWGDLEKAITSTWHEHISTVAHTDRAWKGAESAA